MTTNRRKNAIYSLILIFMVGGVWWYRKTKEAKVSNAFGHYEEVAISGETMGTTYHIKYLDPEGVSYQDAIDSLLEKYNRSLSTYVPNSEISRFNKGTILKYSSPFFYPVLHRSREIYEKTHGAFDPTVGPLVNAWGFGSADSEMPDSATVDSLLQLVNFDSIYFDSISVCKLMEGIALDFNAIAKGYGVDVVAGLLRSEGVQNMMVEIGGEVYCQGKNGSGETWVIGIDDPTAGTRDLLVKVKLDSLALATSGNYRNYYEKDGVKYSHTINPKTGYPVRHTLLSASVFAADCMTADAYATAFMVLGLEGAKKILEENNDLEAYLIYNNEKGRMDAFVTRGIAGSILE